jgi:CheY-like chemotaxis protein
MTDGTPMNASGTISKIVLGVDDAPENLFLLKAAVKAGGYTFLGAKSGLECLAFVRRVTPRLILLDIQMPEMDGFETCRQIRQRTELRGVPVAFLTALKSPDDVKAGLAAGGNDFIVKPFDPARLLERIKHWTGRTIRR